MWYYMLAGKQNGPVDDASLDNLVVKGAIQSDTPVWRDGMADWKPLAEAAPHMARPVLGAMTRDSTCSMCGKIVGAGNLIDIRNMRVCAACKPTAIQSLKEGVSLASQASNTAWNDGKVVLTRDGATLPQRCYKCNCEVAGEPIARKVYWHYPVIYLLILLNLIIYVVVASISRRRATVKIYLCPQHVQRRVWAIAGGWIGTILGLVLMIGTVAFKELLGFDTILLGIPILLLSMILGIIFSNFASAKLIKDDMVWLKGSGRAFRESLPPAS